MYKGLIGLDLDGTILDNEKKISDANRTAIEEAVGQGYCVAPVTGRPMAGVPEELLSIQGIEYAVVSNGAVIYQIEDFRQKKWKRIYEDLLSKEKVLKILELLKEYPIVPDCFLQGEGHMPEYGKEWIPKLGVTPALVEYLLSKRKFYPNLTEYIKEEPERVEKVTANFFLTEEGRKNKREAFKRLKQLEGITVVSGASHNLEINTYTARKGNGMLKLAQLLGITPENTMACGDDGNDLDMIQKAGFGVAMANATQAIRQEADFVTRSNEEDGAAFAIYKFMSLT